MATEISTNLFYNRHVFKDLDLSKPAYEYWNIDDTDIPAYTADINDARDNFKDEASANTFRINTDYDIVYDNLRALIYDELQNVYDNEPNDLFAYG
jgi:hypothetical protein